MTLLLVRHGESVGNVAGVVQGWRDEPLTDVGRSQAEAVASRLAAYRPRIAAIYSSTLARAKGTATPVAAALGLSIGERTELREYGYGAAEGLRWEEIERRFGLTLGQWGQGLIPGEEGPVTFDRRVGECFTELAVRHEGEVAAVVTHGGVITRVVARVLGMTGSAPPRIYLANGSITVVVVEGGEHGIAVLNDDCHLSDVERALAEVRAQAAGGADEIARRSLMDESAARSSGSQGRPPPASRP